MKQISSEIIARIQELKASGYSVRGAAKELQGVASARSVQTYWNILPVASSSVANTEPIIHVDDAESMEAEECKHNWQYLDHHFHKTCSLCGALD